MLADGICRQFGISGGERENIIAAARLHDIGKVAIPSQVLEKPGPLNDAEWAVMRRHTVVGQQILDAVPEMEEVALLVRHSHERWDGEGYPDGIADEEIPLGSRIVACADAFHAVRSDRAYRRGRNAKAALEEIKSCAGTQFDPDVVDALDILVSETRAEMAPGNGVRTTYRSTRLAALLLALALGIGASAIAQFAGSPLARMPRPRERPRFRLRRSVHPSICPTSATCRSSISARLARARLPPVRDRPPAATTAPRPPPARTAATPPATSPRETATSRRYRRRPVPGKARADPPTLNPNPVRPTRATATQAPLRPRPATTVSCPPDFESADQPTIPPGQIPGGNPGHGGLPPGNPLAPGHQPAGTPGHGGLVPSQGGTPPGQVQKTERAAVEESAVEPAQTDISEPTPAA